MMQEKIRNEKNDQINPFVKFIYKKKTLIKQANKSFKVQIIHIND